MQCKGVLNNHGFRAWATANGGVLSTIVEFNSAAAWGQSSQVEWTVIWLWRWLCQFYLPNVYKLWVVIRRL
ncbi:hypothetical protein CV_2277 [Chromobacterium violaceum ATCC 12472]|uniref:Uncharacterized protein n=1 Tax=Chromobacterium violaceum (strain ATCC 12472 / DSM 30191 / JCM 1249 / CCUG 213 / NBRC 12614 / NCIMB 9131 / NCTC 9757 / MK) TaxID=243365 RepID=Q7NVR5_CHRVO|nr:hypothetical protein CV_2277 [Chromobacterium violaceum ATCC 12472]